MNPSYDSPVAMPTESVVKKPQTSALSLAHSASRELFDKLVKTEGWDGKFTQEVLDFLYLSYLTGFIEGKSTY